MRRVKYVSELGNSDFSENDYDNNDNNFSVYRVTSESYKDSFKNYSVEITLNGVHLTAACDTGAPCILVPVTLYNKIKNSVSLNMCKDVYVGYGGNSIKTVGEFLATVEYNGVANKVKAIVTESNSPPLLGRSFLSKFNFSLQQVNVVSDQNSVLVQEIKN